MIWLLAEENGAVAGAGYALTGWHTPPHRAIGCALVAPEQRGHGVGDELRTAIERWAEEHGATELDAPVAEEDDRSLAWASARGYEEIRPKLADGSRPDRDRDAEPHAATRDRDRHLGRATGARRRALGGRARGGTGHPGRGGGPTRAPSRSGSTATWAAPRTARSGLRRARSRRGARLREALVLGRAARIAPSTISPVSGGHIAAAASRRP